MPFMVVSAMPVAPEDVLPAVSIAAPLVPDSPLVPAVRSRGLQAATIAAVSTPAVQSVRFIPHPLRSSSVAPIRCPSGDWCPGFAQSNSRPRLGDVICLTASCRPGPPAGPPRIESMPTLRRESCACLHHSASWATSLGIAPPFASSTWDGSGNTLPSRTGTGTNWTTRSATSSDPEASSSSRKRPRPTGRRCSVPARSSRSPMGIRAGQDGGGSRRAGARRRARLG